MRKYKTKEVGNYERMLKEIKEAGNENKNEHTTRT